MKGTERARASDKSRILILELPNGHDLATTPCRSDVGLAS